MPCPNAIAISIASGETRGVGDGLEIRFDGIQYDHFDDGRFEIDAELTFSREGREQRRRLSTLAPHAREPILGHCVRVLRYPPERVVVEVSVGEP